MPQLHLQYNSRPDSGQLQLRIKIFENQAKLDETLEKKSMYQCEYARIRINLGMSWHVLARLGAVLGTNFLASIIVITLSIMSLAQVDVPSSLEAMLAFLLFPLNACLNPVINTLTTNEFLHGIS